MSHSHSPAAHMASPLPDAAPGTAPPFTETQARVLAGALCMRAGHTPDTALSRYLVRLFASLAHVEGDLAQVLCEHIEPIAQTIEKDMLDPQQHLLAQAVMVLLSVGQERAAAPTGQAWVDVDAFIGAQKRTGGAAGERTDAEKEYARFLNKVLGGGLLRRQHAPASPLQLMHLRERFPNFDAPIRFLAEQSAYATLRGVPFRPMPILLAGPAGCGKTSFTAALAELLGSRSEVLNMASQSCGFAISGMDRGWSSARPGLVFEALQQGPTLSPVIVLDEIDKTGLDARSSPLGPLYSLLEPSSARAFCDEYAGFRIDASQVVWLATANDTGAIPTPLLSRFRVFQVDTPSAENLLAIAQTMLAEMSAGLPQVGALPPAWHSSLSTCSVRELRVGLQEALGRAALRAVSQGASTVTLSDTDLVLSPISTPRSIGFY